MKVLCETQVINRETQACVSAKNTKATLAIGFYSKLVDGEHKKSLEIVHFTSQCKEGKRYKVTGNLEKVFTRFIQDGKATISFIEPPENILIKCDPIQLKSFLQTLKLGLAGKESINLRLNTAAVQAIPQKSQPVQKMVVSKRSEYPIKGFPKSLKCLTISGIQLMKVTFEVCALQNLTVLDLSYNNLSKIPPEMGRLSLTEFNLSHNVLGENIAFQWLNSKKLRNSLRSLDLSANKLEHFPWALLGLEQLVTLKLNNNHIKRVPFAIRRLKNLKFLHMSTNCLSSLPSIFNEYCLDLLDVWGNNFQPPCEPFERNNIANINRLNQVPQLWLLASRVVCQNKIPYSPATLPWSLVNIISECPKCACGKLCYGDTIQERAGLATFQNIQRLVFDRSSLIYVDVVFCGIACLGRKQMFRLFDANWNG